MISKAQTDVSGRERRGYKYPDVAKEGPLSGMGQDVNIGFSLANRGFMGKERKVRTIEEQTKGEYNWTGGYSLEEADCGPPLQFYLGLTLPLNLELSNLIFALKLLFQHICSQGKTPSRSTLGDNEILTALQNEGQSPKSEIIPTGVDPGYQARPRALR
jgi:hypothetical protein